MKPTRHNSRSNGFSLLEAIIVSVILAVLIALFLPALMPAHRRPKKINCTNNLKQIGLAFRQWAMDNNDRYPDQVSVTNGGTMEFVGSGIAYIHFLVMSNELSTPKLLLCSADKQRTNAVSFTQPINNWNISYFVGLDVNETNSMMFLSGDDNLSVNGVKLKRGLAELWTNSPIAWTSQRHSNQGNILLADGSVQTFSSARLPAAFASTGVATNRLLMP